MHLPKRARWADGTNIFNATLNTCGSRTMFWETGEQAISKRNDFGVQLGILAE